MEYVYKILQAYLNSLKEKIAAYTELEKKAELIGNKNLVEHSLNLLQKCEANDIRAGSIFTKLPAKQCDTPSCEYSVV